MNVKKRKTRAGKGPLSKLALLRGSITTHTTRPGGVGPSVWLMHIPYGYMYIFEPTDLIIVDTAKPGQAFSLNHALCTIHTQILPGNEDKPGLLKMRVIDENLTAYRNLIR